MNLAEFTLAVTKVMDGPLHFYAMYCPYAVLAAADVFEIAPTGCVCGMKVYKSVSAPIGMFYVMRVDAVKEILIAEKEVTA